MGTSFELGGLNELGNWDLEDLVWRIAEFLGIPVSAQEQDIATPRVLALSPVHPNPAADEIHLRLALPSRQPVTLAIYDLQGRRVRLLKDHEWMAPGTYPLTVRTRGLQSGVYFFYLKTSEGTRIRKWVLAR